MTERLYKFTSYSVVNIISPFIVGSWNFFIFNYFTFLFFIFIFIIFIYPFSSSAFNAYSAYYMYCAG